MCFVGIMIQHLYCNDCQQFYILGNIKANMPLNQWADCILQCLDVKFSVIHTKWFPTKITQLVTNWKYYKKCMGTNQSRTPAAIYMFKVNKENTKAMHEKCSKLTINTS